MAVSEQFPPFAAPDADAAAEDGLGCAAPGPFPGDTHWYDLPDDDAAPEEDEPLTLGRRLWRALRRR
ncbi:hypothetical protein [Microbispora sp. KK1-11]|uniref:hypothetical protein n=1 Tax=Microbispora sp. KK1-11 TaxID=2053005 RepID=UPI00115AB4ED|nr:hypothetical protein [Microbispora sp. KK1-11]TQS28454.1 hypothetical protein FLW16_14225 [Microbispora sp. KK1-11]